MTATDTGDTVTYTISIRNHANWDLSNVTVKGTVPAGAKYADAWISWDKAIPGRAGGPCRRCFVQAFPGPERGGVCEMPLPTRRAPLLPLSHFTRIHTGLPWCHLALSAPWW